jgi:hypothetical protein
MIRQIVVIAAVTIVCQPLEALSNEPVSVWKGGKGGGVRTHHLTMPMLGGEYYSDRYTMEAQFPDKSKIYVSFFLTNMGKGSGKLTVKSSWQEPNGKKSRSKKKLKAGQYRISAKPFSVSAAGHRLSGTPRNFRVSGRAGGIAFNLVFRPGLRPWRPRTGRTTFGMSGQKYLDTTLVSPRGKVTGWVRSNGRKDTLSGAGYVTHTHQNIAPHHMFKRFLSVRSTENDTVVYLKEYTTPDRYGKKRIGYLYVARAGKVLIARSYAGMRFGRMVTDRKHSSLYKIPFRIRVKSKRKGRKITVTVNASRIRRRVDQLKTLSKLERIVVRQFARPMSYNMDATVTVSVQEPDGQTTTTTHKAAYDVTHLNK